MRIHRAILCAAALAAASGAAANDCKARSWDRFRDDVTWCRVHEANDADATLWRTVTKVVRVGAADDPLSPAFPVELFHDLCPDCENAEDRIVYISRKIAAPDGDGNRRIVMDALLVSKMHDLATVAMLDDLWVAVVVRTDLLGKRNLRGKFRDPIVRIAVIGRNHPAYQ